MPFDATRGPLREGAKYPPPEVAARVIVAIIDRPLWARREIAVGRGFWGESTLLDPMSPFDGQ